jgi:enoyl-CoA hydratase
MKRKNILFRIESAVGLITINRTNQLNALNNETIEELHQQFEEIKNDKNIKVIIISGEGDKAFVAGADIKEFANFSKEQGEKLAKNGQVKLFNLIENFSKPVIAAINGFALGGGLELAMACHIRIASENAKMGLPEVSLGLIPGYGGTQRLAQLIGKGKAFELITTAQMISSKEALEYGLINHLESQDNLIQKCIEISRQIMKNSPNAIAAAIKSINAGYNKDLNGYNEEIESFGNCFESNEFIEGTQAFLEKRRANF